MSQPFDVSRLAQPYFSINSCTRDDDERQRQAGKFGDTQSRRSVKFTCLTARGSFGKSHPLPNAHRNPDVQRQGCGSGMDVSVG